MNVQSALEVVYAGLQTVNDMRPADDPISLSPEAALVGEGGALDSLALMTLVLSIERRVKEIAGAEISLLEKGDLEGQLHFFSTPAALADHIVEKLGNDQDAGDIRLQR
jgi:hypothetical protein